MGNPMDAAPKPILDLDAKLEAMIRQMEDGSDPDVPDAADGAGGEGVSGADEVAARSDTPPVGAEAGGMAALSTAEATLEAVRVELGLADAPTPPTSTNPSPTGSETGDDLDFDDFAAPDDLFDDEPPDAAAFPHRPHLGGLAATEVPPELSELPPAPEPTLSAPRPDPTFQTTAPAPAVPTRSNDRTLDLDARPVAAEPPLPIVGVVDRILAIIKRVLLLCNRPVRGGIERLDQTAPLQNLIGYAAIALLGPGLLLVLFGIWK